MEEKKNTMEQLDIEELSDVNGGYENAVRSGSYSAARASVGVHVAAANEADAIREAVPVIGMESKDIASFTAYFRDDSWSKDL